MLLSFLLFVTPGSALMFFIFRFIKANQTISVAHTDTAPRGRGWRLPGKRPRWLRAPPGRP